MRSFISALFISFFKLHGSLSDMKFQRYSVLCQGFSKPPSKWITKAFIVLQMNSRARGKSMRFGVVNVLVLETNEFKLPAHTGTHLATSGFQAAPPSKLLLTGTTSVYFYQPSWSSYAQQSVEVVYKIRTGPADWIRTDSNTTLRYIPLGLKTLCRIPKLVYQDWYLGLASYMEVVGVSYSLVRLVRSRNWSVKQSKRAPVVVIHRSVQFGPVRILVSSKCRVGDTYQHSTIITVEMITVVVTRCASLVVNDVIAGTCTCTSPLHSRPRIYSALKFSTTTIITSMGMCSSMKLST